MGLIIAVAVVVVALVLAVVLMYNGLVAKRNRSQNAWPRRSTSSSGAATT